MAYILSDVGAEMVITDHKDRLLLPSSSKGITLMDQKVQQQPTGAVNVSVIPDDLAYIIYTSGSTGNPKGDRVAHRSIQHLVSWHNMQFDEAIAAYENRMRARAVVLGQEALEGIQDFAAPSEKSIRKLVEMLAQVGAAG